MPLRRATNNVLWHFQLEFAISTPKWKYENPGLKKLNPDFIEQIQSKNTKDWAFS